MTIGIPSLLPPIVMVGAEPLIEKSAGLSFAGDQPGPQSVFLALS
jgi:hypothetical protein